MVWKNNKRDLRVLNERYGINMHNYLKHETLVRYMDGILENSMDWDWFVKEIEDNFELKDVSTWNDYIGSTHLLNIYSYIVRIVNASEAEIKTENHILMDIVLLSRYYWGKIDQQYCKEQLSTLYGKITLLVIWITRLENADNGTSFIYHMDLLQQHNYYELINMNMLSLEQESVLNYCRELRVDGFDIAVKCLEDNFLHKYYPMHEDFLERYKENILSVNCFDYQSIEKDRDWSWEESYFIDMLNTSIVGRELIPVIVKGKMKFPNTDLWTEDVIQRMIDYFSDPTASFVLETIRYILFNEVPSVYAICTHCRLYCESVDSLESYEKVNVSSYLILRLLFKNKQIQSMNKEKDYIEFVKKIQETQDINLISDYSNDSMPVSKTQKQALNSYYSSLYKTIDDIKSVDEFIVYLTNKDVVKKIDCQYFSKVIGVFNSYTEDKNDRMIPSLFYDFMRFLIEVNAHGLSIDKHIVQGCINQVQQLWQKEYYDVIVGNMKTYEYSSSIPTIEVEKYNDAIINKPITIASLYSITREADLIDLMEKTSRHPLLHMVSKLDILPIFPVKTDSVNYNRHEVDEKLKEYVDRLNNEKGYRFINKLETDKYVSALHQRQKENANLLASFLTKERELYEKVASFTEFELIPYSENLTLAHITQLFPVLESVIRELAIQTRYAPFKENTGDFMKYKDSSSILREIILDVYDITKSFENVPDLYLAYNYMFNGNSLNVRNECIHGRDYLTGNGLRFGFRITLISINMIYERVKKLR